MKRKHLSEFIFFVPHTFFVTGNISWHQTLFDSGSFEANSAVVLVRCLSQIHLIDFVCLVPALSEIYAYLME
jgi:hypothetical protein